MLEDADGCVDARLLDACGTGRGEESGASGSNAEGKRNDDDAKKAKPDAALAAMLTRVLWKSSETIPRWGRKATRVLRKVTIGGHWRS